MPDTCNFSQVRPAGLLATRHFVVGGHKRLLHEARVFHLGILEHVDPDDVNELILRLLHILDDLAQSSSLETTKYRDIVLVGHGLRSDLLVLRRRGILFGQISTTVAKLDKSCIVKEVLGMNFRLHGLLNIFYCPLLHIHNAGNDGNFTLRELFAPCLLRIETICALK
ncbi:hypothetical protein BDZ45DRAFT_810093 [Acephala macrosclerotiorum]|nr:hypothetical protein BDZ45DRAFT_810093 [Acephala macrosclerotiorum]